MRFRRVRGGDILKLRGAVYLALFRGLWRHQTGRIFSPGYGPSRLWTRAAPPPLRFARRRKRDICRSSSFEHVTCRTVCVCPQTSYPRRYRASSDKGCPKQKKKNSKNPISLPVVRLVGFSFLEKSYQFSRNPTSRTTGRIFLPPEILPVFDW